MKLAVYSIQSTLFEGDAEKLIVETPLGQMAILDKHVPLISALNGPILRIVDKNGIVREVPLASGILEIRPGSEAVVLAEIAKEYREQGKV